MNDTATQGLDGDDFVGRVAYLKTGDTAEIEATADRMAEFRELAEQSITEMRALLDDPDANIGRIDRFEMTEDIARCRWCSFKELYGR